HLLRIPRRIKDPPFLTRNESMNWPCSIPLIRRLSSYCWIPFSFPVKLCCYHRRSFNEVIDVSW
ncbi:hypothetical protein PENTCL1PPCAC_13199, partial [Pristionchus entomophagus]